MSAATTTSYIALVPRDGLFCKDGRGWHTSASGRGHALDWPWPSTVLGALRTAWGRGEERRSGQPFDRDAWLARTKPIELGRALVLRRPHERAAGRTWVAADRVWPVPSDALWLEGEDEVYPLRPAKPTVETLGREVAGIEEAREALWVPQVAASAKPRTPPRWWSEANLVAWLSGGSVKAGSNAAPDAGAFQIERRVQAHVGIQAATLTADDGVLFAHDIVETLETAAEWAIAAAVTLPDENILSIATLGADGRLAHVENLDGGLFDPPAALLGAFEARRSRGIRLVVTTPAEFERGWLPFDLTSKDGKIEGKLPGLDVPVELCAAFVGRPVHVSGWDMAERKPKPTLRMVPPGSVYFLQRTDGQMFGESEARALWLAATGRHTDQGFGCVVPGIWNPNGS